MGGCCLRNAGIFGSVMMLVMDVLPIFRENTQCIVSGSHTLMRPSLLPVTRRVRLPRSLSRFSWCLGERARYAMSASEFKTSDVMKPFVSIYSSVGVSSVSAPPSSCTTAIADSAVIPGSCGSRLTSSETVSSSASPSTKVRLHARAITSTWSVDT